MTEVRIPNRPRAIILAVAALIFVIAASVAFLAQKETAPTAPRPLAAPTAAPPPAEPLVFAQITEADARKINAKVPFASDRGPPARPFAFGDAPDSRERATDCLASAMWYEAGGDARGQEAVAQVVLNRVRHPAYPGTVCGVVFQGAERSTGCQFTFTCDGAMRRIPPEDAFTAARERARAMLSGRIQREVGLATHYHTDWVHPIWSAQLEKIAQIDTHLFFRWAGAWGSLSAMRKSYRGGEPFLRQLAALSVAHRVVSEPGVPPGTQDVALVSDTAQPAPRPIDLGNGRFRIFFSAVKSGNVQAMAALQLCGTSDYCKLTGVVDGGTVVFVYLRNRAAGFERVRWDCDMFKRPTPAQCFGKVRDVTEPPKPSGLPTASFDPG